VLAGDSSATKLRSLRLRTLETRAPEARIIRPDRDTKIKDGDKDINLKDLKAGAEPVRLELAVNQCGAVVVVGIKRHPFERLGIDFIDAPKAKNGVNRKGEERKP